MLVKPMEKSADLRRCQLYAILDTGYLQGRDPVELTEQMIAGGIDILQIRAKDTSPEKIRHLAEAVLAVTRPAGIPLILNDHPRIAAEVDAEGVHVGQDDLSVAEARHLAGEGKWVGKSTHSLAQALAAVEEGADYIGVGPVFATPTKPTYTPVGLDLVRKVALQIPLPFFCIGGIKLDNVAQVLEMGARRLVVVSGILQAPDVASYCRALKKNLDVP